MLNAFQAKRPETMEVQIIVHDQISLKEGRKKSKKWIVSEIQYIKLTQYAGRNCCNNFDRYAPTN